jgi:hypothetical protein
VERWFSAAASEADFDNFEHANSRNLGLAKDCGCYVEARVNLPH